MKKVILSFIGASVLSAFMFSCQKEKLSTSNTFDDSNIYQTKEVNEYNPYEYVGEIHNTVLSAVFDETSYNGLSKSAKLVWIYGKVNNELLALSKESLQVLNSQNYITNDECSLIIGDSVSTEEYFDGIVTNLSNTTEAYLNEFKDICDLNAEEEDLSSFDASIAELEQTVFEDTYITADEKKVVLSSIALGKYSFHFWQEGAGSALDKKPKPWLADVGGFLGGAGTTIWGWFEGYNWGNPITNGIALGTACSAGAREM